ncbi:Ig-like domain-containing protein [Adhaeribacter terreus]|uniref:Ig-like domain-containing protein n=1 Tax=Adhaeribacter terreus TaxID=529703 RepID=A0ABW0EDB3_9BACT
MKNQSLFNYFAGIFAIVFLLSGCDKFEEDTAPLLASTLVVRNDFYTTTKNQAIQLHVLANDTISGQTTVEFGKPMHGTIQPTGTPGSVFYQPETNFVGRDSVNYKVCIGPNCISASVIITVQADSTGNPCTVFVADDTVSVYANQSSVINILQNDITCNKIPVIISRPDSGLATLNSNHQLVYTPQANFTGTDVLWYSIGSSMAKVTIRVKPAVPNCTLTANPDVVNLLHNQVVDSVAINVAANDIWCTNAPTISIHFINQSSYGSLQVIGSGTNSRIVYMTSTPLHNITDSFQYSICQGTNCSTSTVTVNIQ